MQHWGPSWRQSAVASFFANSKKSVFPRVPPSHLLASQSPPTPLILQCSPKPPMAVQILRAPIPLLNHSALSEASARTLLIVSQSPHVAYRTVIIPTILFHFCVSISLSVCCQVRNQKIVLHCHFPFLSQPISALRFFFAFSLFSPSFNFEKCQTYRKFKRKAKWSLFTRLFHLDSPVLIFCVTFAFSSLFLSPIKKENILYGL